MNPRIESTVELASPLSRCPACPSPMENGKVAIVDHETGKTIEPVPMHLSLQDQDRATVRVELIHEHWGDQPFSEAAGFSCGLEGIEQPYSRRLVVGEEWAPIDFGWIDRPGYILVKNLEGGLAKVNPTEGERADIAARVVLIGYEGKPLWEIPPQESFGPVKCIGKEGLVWRCASGRASVRVAVLTR